MFITSADYKTQVEKIIQENSEIDMAVAFWGKGAEKLFVNTGMKIRILCNLTSGGTNPAPIEKLNNKKDFKSIEIRHLDDLHAKVLVGDKSAVVGSANISTNGLNIEEGEFDGWQEAGFVTHDAVELRKMRQWFEQQWKRGVKVNNDLLEETKINWKKRRISRIDRSSEAKSVLNMTSEQLRDKNIYLALWSECASDESVAANKEQHESQMASLGITNAAPPYFLENWNEPPYEILLNQYVISVYVGPRGGVKVYGAYFVEKELFPIDGIKLHICETLTELRGLPFGSKQRSDLEKLVKNHVTKIKPSSASVLISLEDFIDEYSS